MTRSLRERVAGATKADRIVDFWLEVRFGNVGGLTPERILSVSHEHDEYYISWLQGKVRKRFTRYYGGSVKPFTASVDAALALIERVTPGAQVVLMLVPNRAQAWVGNDDVGEIISAPTPALALISALLAAVETQGAAQ